jgi:hypothetical protein
MSADSLPSGRWRCWPTAWTIAWPTRRWRFSTRRWRCRGPAKLTLCRLCLVGVLDTGSTLSDVGKRLLHLRYIQLQSIVGFDATANFGATAQAANTFHTLFAETGQRPALWGQPLYSRLIASRISEILHPGGDAKQAGVISTMLMLDAMNLPEESEGYIGSEASLTARYGVPRNLLREGIRILERDGFIRTEQGRTGGIKMGEADGSEIVERAIRIFEFLGCAIPEVAALAREFRMTAIELIMKDTDAAGFMPLAASIRQEIGEGGPSALFAMLARRTGNNFLIFCEQVCQRLLQQSVRKAVRLDRLNLLAGVVESGNMLLSRRLIAQFHNQFTRG